MSSIPPSDLAYRVLRLEQQLESYRRLHAEELEQIRQAVADLKVQVLAFVAPPAESKNQAAKED